ncbi:MAG: 30S ribosomal protein S12 methylthiotransferase RimO [Phycisphaerae bacterium]
MNSKVTGPQVVRRVALVSLGCPKNLIDSERMLGLLAADGIAITDDHAAADAIVINTCGFLEDSKIEALAVINDALEEKNKALIKGVNKRVVVAGCLVQRQRSQLLDAVPGIDALVGVFDRENIVTAVRGSTAVAANADMGNFHPVTQMIHCHDRRKVGYFESDTGRLRLTPRHYGYLRISEGCNQGCTFCTIPGIRGRMRSKPLADIVTEARELIADGAFELNIIGQDTTSYGGDIGYDGPGQGLTGLIQTLDKLKDAGWIRLMYAYPSCFIDDMIKALADAGRWVKYIDIPLQHIHDDILHTMRRKTSRRQITTLLEKIRKWIPGISIRTTFISGFPGETEAQHQELVKFVRQFEFDCLGVFEYSPEPETPAGRLWKTHAVAAQTAKRRREEIMLAQQDVVFKINQAQVGKTVAVLIDTVDKKRRTAVGRHAGQAPDIDGQVLLHGLNATAGDLIQVEIEDWKHYDLIAKPINYKKIRAGHKPLSLPIFAAGTV